PQAPSQLAQSAGTLGQSWPRSQNVPRASRLVTDPVTGLASLQQNMASPLQNTVKPLTADTGQLMPGTLLRGGRYRLQEKQGGQEWLSGVSESMWVPQDAQRGARQIMMCEVVLPESGSVVMQLTCRTPTMALKAVGRHPHIQTLWDAFPERRRPSLVLRPV